MSDDISHLMWTNLDSRLSYDAKLFRLVTSRRRSSEGKEASFISVDSPNWVTIIPELIDETGERRFLLVRQFRHGTQRVGLEFPAGAVDFGEDERNAATRELLEETGYEAAELIELGSVSPNPAFMANKTYTYLARGLTKKDEQNLDEHEILDMQMLYETELAKFIGLAPFDSAITIQAWFFYLRWLGRV
ncbi:hypothetical protein S1OALGB6SA_1792 [Olavius algarvensis spirochete endosymbiont]|uniref:NUDIX hydrolase n=1 Tax=Olavius algarvensis spirochete endosymbiont TaxID=260710 RepID=UPI000F274B3B|nr:NUDIX hydrolase [Olavius algarvensis spirochete endosymbiont]VDB00704.1 hypothetical protein S1OALGB6SA_1792 [Olavius algarvensis spirochete endosymbiont]